MNTVRAIGLMSGTSLDGLDLAACIFREENEGWNYEIAYATTIGYSDSWKKKLSDPLFSDPSTLSKLDHDYGLWLGTQVKDFIAKTEFQPELIASHGHTIQHRPDEGYTVQVGSGKNIQKLTGIPTINNFRSLDISLGGQGAPLVPIGDQILFSNFDYCLNLGGIANISYDDGQHRRAFDLCPVNMAFNDQVAEAGLNYDLDGEIAASGEIREELLNKLNQLDYYTLPPPKSLGAEWYVQKMKPLLSTAISLNDRLATLTCHIAQQMQHQIMKIAPGSPGPGSVLVTGGGAYNKNLIRALEKQLDGFQIIIPESTLVDYKEALVFALMGILRRENKFNTLCSVTGASRDSSGGIIYT